MSDAIAIANAPIPMAVLQGAGHASVVASESWRELFGSSLPEPLVEQLDNCHRTRQPFELQLRVQDGRLFRVVMQPLPDDKLLVTCIDISEVEIARADALRATRRKEDVLAAVSHDLRAPMSTIMLWERVLRDRIDEVEVRTRALEAIRESATVQSDLIAELVQLSSVFSGAVRLERDRIELESILAKAIELQAASADAKGVSLHLDFQPALGNVRGDRARLHHALSKVVESAVRMTPAGETITIAARREQRSVEIAIGNHVAQSALVPIATLELRLVIASELLALHDGTLEAKRPQPSGTPSFSIRLPVESRRSMRA
jgi:signal transduction histidine kinase